MTKSKVIDNSDFIAITLSDALSEYPAALRTAWLELSTDRLYISAALADLKVLYREGKKLEKSGKSGLPIIEHNQDRFVDIDWLREICPDQAAHLSFLEKMFRDGLFNRDREGGRQ